MEHMIIKIAETLLSIFSESSTNPLDQVASNGQVEIKSKKGSGRSGQGNERPQGYYIALKDINEK